MKLIKFVNSLYAVVVFLCVFSVNAFSAENAVVGDGKVVKFEYTLKVDGKLIESNQGKESMEYVHGQGQIIAGLADKLTGMKVGEEKIIIVKPTEGYGEVVPEAIKAFPKSSFGDNFNLGKGMVIEIDDAEAGKIPALVEDVTENEVVLNFNHPLAGKTLEFDVKILGIK